MIKFSDEYWMEQALRLAEKAAEMDEVPVGAVVIKDNQVIGEGFNQPITSNDPTAHAEIIALRDAANRVGNYRLPGAILYVTIEPCTMCAGALVHSRIGKLVYGATEPKSGAVVSQSALLEAGYLNHKIQVVGGVLADRSASLIQVFFQRRR